MTKEPIIFIFFLKLKTRTCWKGEREAVTTGFGFRVRECHFSLEYRAIRPSTVFGTRRKAALRKVAYAWVSDLRSLDKLCEVGVSPYLGFTLHLSTLQCFGWFEALNDRLIGSKAWNRGRKKNVIDSSGQPVTFHERIWVIGCAIM